MKQQLVVRDAGRKVSVAAIFLGLSFSALGQSATLNGGGATLPGVAYVGGANSTPTTHPNRLTDPSVDVIDGASLFGAYTNFFNAQDTTTPAVSYCQLGSGAGKSVLDGVNAASLACGTWSTAGTGFSGATAEPHFVGSDAPMSQAEYTTFNTNKGTTRGQPVQFPSIAGSVAIIYQNSDSHSQINLSKAEVCLIFAGKITNWSQLPGGLPSRAITLVGRQDNSGTSFSFSNFLSAACTGTISADGVVDTFSGTNHFQTTQTWTTDIASLSPAATYTLASGNPGVVSKVGDGTSATPGINGAIGYAEVANTQLTNPTVSFAKVNGQDPIKNFPANLTVTLATADQVITGTNSTTGRPTLGAASPVPATAGCLNFADPSSYSNPTTGYPIIGVTNLLTYFKGNGLDTQHVRVLLTAPYNNSFKATVGDIGGGTGFAFLTITDSLGNILDPVDVALKLGGCINN